MPDLDPETLDRLTVYAAAPRGNRATRTWTVAELRRLLDPAVSVQTIAADLGVPRATVTYELVRLRRTGFPVSRRPSHWTRSPRSLAIEADLRAGMTEAEAARRHGVTPARVREVRIRAGIPVSHRAWTEDERSVVIIHQDRPTPEVAAMLGRSRRAVDSMRAQLIAEGRIRAKIGRTRSGD